MISDLLKIHQALKNAQSEEEKATLDARLLEKIHDDIQKLFDDPEYPRRHRSFKIISSNLGVFDENPQKLKEILYKMGAKSKNSKDGIALWHLPKTNSGQGNQQSSVKKSWTRLFIGVITITAIIAILSYFGIKPTNIYNYFISQNISHAGLCVRNETTIEELQICLENGGR